MERIFKSNYILMKLQISILVLLLIFFYLHSTRENFMMPSHRPILSIPSDLGGGNANINPFSRNGNLFPEVFKISDSII